MRIMSTLLNTALQALRTCNKRRSLGLSVALVLVGWGVAIAEPLKVACIGDSITAGFLLADPATQAYPAQLQTLLGTNYVVRNFGHSGSGVLLTTKRPNGEFRAFRRYPEHRAALEWHPDIVICNLGINDCGDFRKPGMPEQFIANYTTLLRDYLALEKPPRLYLWTRLCPLGPKNRFYRSDEPFKMERALAEVARSVAATPIDMASAMQPLLWEHFPDHLHPDALGAKQIAATTAAILLRPDTLTIDQPSGSNMVVPWGYAFTGTARPGATITTTVGTTRAAPNGTWRILAYGCGPHVLPSARCPQIPETVTFSDGETQLSLTNLVFGPLWLCAGQSNMRMRLGELSEATAEATACTNTSFRIYTEDHIWHVVTPHNAKTFSALAIMMGRRLAQNQPFGIVQVAVGGAPVEAFLSPESMTDPELLPALTNRHRLQDNADYKPAWCRVNPRPEFEPCAIWFKHLAQWDPVYWDGILWYQGESNATTALKPDTPMAYDYLLAGQKAFARQILGDVPCTQPLLIVQLPGKMNRPWEIFRKAQEDLAKSDPRIHLIPTKDLGHPTNVHPVDKYPIVERALEILKTLYKYNP